MDFSDLRGIDAIISAALAALGGRQVREAFKSNSRNGEIAYLRQRVHDLADAVQTEMLKRVAADVTARSLEATLERMERRLELIETRLLRARSDG